MATQEPAESRASGGSPDCQECLVPSGLLARRVTAVMAVTEDSPEKDGKGRPAYRGLLAKLDRLESEKQVLLVKEEPSADPVSAACPAGPAPSGPRVTASSATPSPSRPTGAQTPRRGRRPTGLFNMAVC